MTFANPHIGCSLDAFLAEEGILDETRALAIKETVAWQAQQAMHREKIYQDRDGAPHEDRSRRA